MNFVQQDCLYFHSHIYIFTTHLQWISNSVFKCILGKIVTKKRHHQSHVRRLQAKLGDGVLQVKPIKTT